jgi:hypothetical protein
MHRIGVAQAALPPCHLIGGIDGGPFRGGVPTSYLNVVLGLEVWLQLGGHRNEKCKKDARIFPSLLGKQIKLMKCSAYSI